MTPVISAIVSWLVIAGVAFANVDVGSTLPNSSLEGLDGIRRSLVDPQRVTVFLFFDPQQDRSIEVLGALAELQQDLDDADVRWVGVVSDRFSPERALSALDNSGARLETVIDSGDRLYGNLGVRLYPTLGIADAGATLRAYIPYAKVNYMSTLEAHLLHTLGRIDDAELDRATHPTAIDISSTEAEIGRTLKLARMLWANGKKDKALTMAREAADKAPGLAEPYALVGIFLVEDSRCEEARTSLDKALEIDPDHPEAHEALIECQVP